MRCVYNNVSLILQAGAMVPVAVKAMSTGMLLQFRGLPSQACWFYSINMQYALLIEPCSRCIKMAFFLR